MILRRWLASVKTRLRGAAAEQETLLQDLRYRARILHRSPRFTVAVVLILGVGVAMITTVFAIVDSLLLNAVPFAELHRLVVLNRWGPSGGGPVQPAAMVESWRNEKALFDRVETYERVERVFTGGGEPETMQVRRVQIPKPDGGQRPLGIPATP